MKIRLSLPRQMLFISLILGAAVVHADAGGPLGFSLDPGARAMDRSLGGWQTAGKGARIGATGLAILGGVIGNLIGLVAGVYIANLDLGGGYSDPCVGAIAGSVCGSTLGVYIAGSAGGRRGKFGSALLGSLLGEVAAVALAYAIPGQGFPFLAGFLILPPIGAAILFNHSLTSRSLQAGNGLFNLAGGKLGLSVPDIRVRPVSVAGGGRAKPGMRFDVSVLTVEL